MLTPNLQSKELQRMHEVRDTVRVLPSYRTLLYCVVFFPVEFTGFGRGRSLLDDYKRGRLDKRRQNVFGAERDGPSGRFPSALPQ